MSLPFNKTRRSLICRKKKLISLHYDRRGKLIKSILIRIKENEKCAIFIYFIFRCSKRGRESERNEIIDWFWHPAVLFSVTVAKVEDISSRAEKKKRYTIAESYIINKRGDFNNHAVSFCCLAFYGTSSISLELLVERFSQSDRELFKMKQTKTHIKISRHNLREFIIILFSAFMFFVCVFLSGGIRFQIDNFFRLFFRSSIDKKPIEDIQLQSVGVIFEWNLMAERDHRRVSP